MDRELDTAEGFVAPDVRFEFPGLRLRWLRLESPPRLDSREVQSRLRHLSDRFHGAGVVAMRTRPIHRAYRAFFRQTGLDPDLQPPPAEQAAASRLMRGELSARDALHGALLIALVETGVPVWALDGDRIHDGGLGIRQTGEGETMGEGQQSAPMRPGRLVVADEVCVHAVLFGALARGHEADRSTRRVALFAVGVAGVPDMHLEEALWGAVQALAGG
jgi:DNA/RNA-binding domain of Phe-tRNA-synthetase-like protein